MILSELLKVINIESNSQKIIKGICEDSRIVKEDELFLAFDLKYLNDAKNKHAITLSESPYSDYTCEDLKVARMKLLKHFYNHDYQHIKIIGVCGSNGKSSVSKMLYAILKKQYRCMLIGTHHIEFHGENIITSHTTPPLCQLTKLVNEAIELHYDYIIMEVSSHAIDQDRIHFLKFDYLLYTNILQDHLDYHKTRLHYRFTKYKLRYYLKPNGFIILNEEEAFVSEFKKICNQNIYSIQNKDLQIIESNLEKNVFCYLNDCYELKLLGDYQIKNMLLVIQTCLFLNINTNIIKNQLLQEPLIKGRLQCIYHQDYQVFVDYAHTQDALKQVLLFLNKHKKHKLYVIIGCGGNRDRSKRKIMGELACRYSDLAIFTSANPRNESIDQIIDDMCQMPLKNYKIIKNRHLAIKYSIQLATKDDIIIVVGKGDEITQEIKGNQFFFHDESSVKYFIKMKEDLK